MPSGFPGFSDEMTKFFRGLKRNNRREWFQPRKPVFDEKVKAPMFELIRSLTADMMEYAPDHVCEPEKAVYRIYRDTRFSKDKTPYKDHIGALFPRAGLPKHGGANYYFGVSDEGVEVAAGVYMPGSDELLALRTHIADNHREFSRLIADRALKRLMGSLWGDQLTRVPKGFACDHPAAGLLRYKQWIFYVTLDGALAVTPRLQGEVSRRFRAMAPFVDFLNRPLIARRKPRPEEIFV